MLLPPVVTRPESESHSLRSCLKRTCSVVGSRKKVRFSDEVEQDIGDQGDESPCWSDDPKSPSMEDEPSR